MKRESVINLGALLICGLIFPTIMILPSPVTEGFIAGIVLCTTVWFMLDLKEELSK